MIVLPREVDDLAVLSSAPSVPPPQEKVAVSQLVGQYLASRTVPAPSTGLKLQRACPCRLGPHLSCSVLSHASWMSRRDAIRRTCNWQRAASSLVCQC